MTTNSQEQEIDVSQIGKSISKGFQKAVNRCFDLLFFIQKKFLIVFVLILLIFGLIDPSFLTNFLTHYSK